MSFEENSISRVTSVVARENSYLKVTEAPNYTEKFKNFSMVDQFRMKTSIKPRMDLIDRLAEITRSSVVMFKEIKENADPRTLIAIMSHFEDTKDSQRRDINKRLAALRNVDLVIKLKKIEKMPSLIDDIPEMGLIPAKFSYMINPYIIKPKNYKKHERNYRKARLLWHATKGEGNKVKEILTEKDETDVDL